VVVKGLWSPLEASSLRSHPPKPNIHSAQMQRLKIKQTNGLLDNN